MHNCDIIEQPERLIFWLGKNLYQKMEKAVLEVIAFEINTAHIKFLLNTIFI